ncbi:MAG: DMT family transporter [Sphingosinicella sp.]
MSEAAPAGRGVGLAFAGLVVANLCLAAGPWLVRLADVGPVSAAFWRLALALPFIAWLGWRHHRPGTATPWLIAAVALGGLFFAADLAAWHAGILMTRMANATLFGNFASLLFAIYGFVLLRALPRPGQAAALLMAAAGTLLLLGGRLEMSWRNFSGDLLALLAGILYFLYLVAVDRARRTMRAWPVLAIATMAGTLPLLAFAAMLGERILPGDWTPLILLSIGSQLVGQGLLVWAIGKLSPVVVGLAFLIQPVAAAAIGWLAHGEALSGADLLGAGLICAALVMIRLPPRPVATAAAAAH